jgi:hypothetical protein
MDTIKVSMFTLSVNLVYQEDTIMADIFGAYKFLNDSLKLNLGQDKLAAVERAFKKSFMENNGYTKAQIGDVDNWEFFAHVVPQKTNSN